MFYENKKKKKMTIYITRIKHGKYSNSAPCNICISKIREMNIAKIKYTDNNGNVIRCNTSKYNHYHESKVFRLISHLMKI